MDVYSSLYSLVNIPSCPPDKSHISQKGEKRDRIRLMFVVFGKNIQYDFSPYTDHREAQTAPNLTLVYTKCFVS